MAETSKSPSIAMLNDRVQQILKLYESDSPAVKAQIARIFLAGRLGGTGRIVILPIDQGVEHGPAKSFAMNKPAFNPLYFYQMAIDAGLSALAAPLGLLETGASTYAGRIPLILKLNSANGLFPASHAKDQAVTASVKDAVRLGCAAIGLTLYPGSEKSFDMIEEARDLIREAKDAGLASVVWAYPRGGDLNKIAESALDVAAYSAQITAQIGAHILKLKLPSSDFFDPEMKKLYDKNNIAYATVTDRVRHIMDSALGGRRVVIFSGGPQKTDAEVFDDARGIREGGGYGSIIGRNCFQRPHDKAMDLLDKMIGIYA
jgi:fructose-bisphosphate aldolase, class I